jgi:hypothetical protein
MAEEEAGYTLDIDQEGTEKDGPLAARGCSTSSGFMRWIIRSCTGPFEG